MTENRKITGVQKTAIQSRLSELGLSFDELAIQVLGRTSNLPASLNDVNHRDAGTMIEFGIESGPGWGYAAPYPCSELVSHCWHNCHYCVNEFLIESDSG